MRIPKRKKKEIRRKKLANRKNRKKEGNFLSERNEEKCELNLRNEIAGFV